MLNFQVRDSKTQETDYEQEAGQRQTSSLPLPVGELEMIDWKLNLILASVTLMLISK